MIWAFGAQSGVVCVAEVLFKRVDGLGDGRMAFGAPARVPHGETRVVDHEVPHRAVIVVVRPLPVLIDGADRPPAIVEQVELRRAVDVGGLDSHAAQAGAQGESMPDA